MVLKVGEVGRQVFGEESSSFLWAVVFFVTTSELDPLGEGLDVKRKTSRRVVATSGCSRRGTSTFNTRLSRSDLSLNILLFLKHAFPSDEVGNTLNEDINQSGLRFT